MRAFVRSLSGRWPLSDALASILCTAWFQDVLLFLGLLRGLVSKQTPKFTRGLRVVINSQVVFGDPRPSCGRSGTSVSLIVPYRGAEQDWSP